MVELRAGAWPPAPIRTGRLVLRAAEARDRDAFLDLFSSPEVGAYIGGAQPRDVLAGSMPGTPGQRAGLFVVEHDRSMVGVVTLDRRPARRPGRMRPGAEETELGYMLLPSVWGRGYATEACTAVLGWYGRACPGEPLVLRTRADHGSSLRLAARLGFTEAARFQEYGAEQWLGVLVPAGPSS